MGTVNELLTIARKQIGVTEMPPESNRVKYNSWFYKRDVMGSTYPWCACFVAWCFDQAGVKLPRRTASCGDLMRAAQAAGCWVVSNFQPGDVVIFDFSGKQTTTQHCGIVEAVLPDFGVQSIEGNTSSGDVGSQDNGGGVFRRRRAQKYIIGAVRPKFEKETEDMDIDAMLSKMTDEQAYKLLEKANRHAAKLQPPVWAEKELAEAIKMGITDGGDPMVPVTRYQAAIMAKRAAQK